LAGLLLVSGYLAIGFSGIVLSFWVLLFWYSLWRKPCRYEMLLLSIVGIAGGMLFIPVSLWSTSRPLLLIGFGLLSLSPWLSSFANRSSS
jgi:hypothetical protein